MDFIPEAQIWINTFQFSIEEAGEHLIKAKDDADMVEIEKKINGIYKKN